MGSQRAVALRLALYDCELVLKRNTLPLFVAGLFVVVRNPLSVFWKPIARLLSNE
jgi:hypothetical protein